MLSAKRHEEKIQVTRRTLVFFAFIATFVTSSLLCIRGLSFDQTDKNNFAKAEAIYKERRQENPVKIQEQTSDAVEMNFAKAEWITEQRRDGKTIKRIGTEYKHNDITIEAFENIIKQRDSEEKGQKLPDLIGIGVKKCGTGALAHFLSLHPLIALPTRRVETFFFATFFSKGMRWYRNLMPRVANTVRVMEKTPSYFYATATVPRRIKQSLPGVKLILSLCDPVLRSFSDFVHESYNPQRKKNSIEYAEDFDDIAQAFLKRFAQLNMTLEEAGRLAQAQCKTARGNPKACVFAKGVYHHYLSEWLALFNESQLLIINGDRWISDPGPLIEEIQEFIGIPVLLRREDFVRPFTGSFYCFRRWWQEGPREIGWESEDSTKELDDNLFCLGPGKGRTRNGVRSMFNGTYAKLKEFYKPHNERLYRVLGRDFGW